MQPIDQAPVDSLLDFRSIHIIYQIIYSKLVVKYKQKFEVCTTYVPPLSNTVIIRGFAMQIRYNFSTSRMYTFLRKWGNYWEKQKVQENAHYVIQKMLIIIATLGLINSASLFYKKKNGKHDDMSVP